MQQPGSPTTFEEGINKLAEIAKERGDEFRVKVMRRVSPAAPLETLATLDGCTVEHLVGHETWLPQLCGGSGNGQYVLQVYHGAALAHLVVVLVTPVISGQPRDVDAAAPARAGWLGPKVLVSPPAIPLRLTQPTPFNNDMPGPGNRAASPNVDPGRVDAGTGHLYTEQRLTEARLALQEQRASMQLEAFKQSIVADQKRMEGKLSDVLDAVKMALQRPAPVEKPIMEQVAPVLTALTPLVAAWMTSQSNAEARRQEAESRREEREAREREAREKREAAMAERIGAQSSETAKVLASMSDVVANSMRNSLQMVATMQELQAPAESPWEALLREVPQAIATFAALKSGGAPQPALPAGRGAPTADLGQPPADDEPIPLDQAKPEDVVEDLAERMKAHEDPEEVVSLYVEALKSTPGFVAFVKTSGGLLALFRKMLTDAWLSQEANTKYVQSVLVLLNKMGEDAKARKAAREAVVPAAATPAPTPPAAA